KNTVFIKHVLKETQDELYEKTKEKQFVAYPEINDCIEKLKIIYNKGFDPQINFQELKKYRWNYIVSEFIELIKKEL
ncbi:MAG: hypothetical protein N2446_01700, partial [Elusimicrobiales bacterium]|nr:hypothetical protein [Elusimicrobiales bacterium]